MTLLVPALILAILVLAWIAWLAFGPRSNPALPSYLLATSPLGKNNRESDAIEPDLVAARTGSQETEHVRIRLHAPNGSAASLNGNAMHLELRPMLHSYPRVNVRDSEAFQA